MRLANAQDAKIVIALDFADAKPALAFVQQIDPKLCRVKVEKKNYSPPQDRN